jgi:ATP-binding cassette subfamily B protein
VLVLDNTTSAVDATTEAAIYTTLRAVTAQRTTLLIAHRQSSLALADRIAVLDGGQVSDVGTQAELRGRCALFRVQLAGPSEIIENVTAAPSAVPGPGQEGTTARLWPADVLADSSGSGPWSATAAPERGGQRTRWHEGQPDRPHRAHS